MLTRAPSSRSLSAASLIILATLPFVPTLFAPFVADDYFHVEQATKLGDALTRGWVLPIDTGGAWWTPPGLSVQYFRPLVVITFVIDRFLFGAHAAGYHLTNLVLHATTTLLAWGVARRVLDKGVGAWAAAALFAIHPCHAQAVAWISGRTDVVASLFYVAAVLAHLHSRPLQRCTVKWLLLSLVLFFVALTGKEMAITFPAVILLHNLLRPEGESTVTRWIAPAAAGAVAAVYLGLRIALVGGFHPPPWPFAYHLGDAGLLRHLITAPILYLGDLTLFVPADPMVTLPFWTAHLAALAAFAVIVLATFRGTLLRTRGKGAWAWSLGWMAITLMPVATLTVGEHFLYLPSIGYSILVGSQVPAAASMVGAGARRQLAIVGALVFAVAVWRVEMFDGAARSAARTVAGVVAALDRAPEVRWLLVADLPVAASLAFPHAVRLARPERVVDSEILDITPTLHPRPQDRSSVTFVAPDTVTLRRDNGFLTSYIDRALAGPRPPFRPGDVIERPGYDVTIDETTEGRPLAFKVHLRDPSHTLVLRDTGRGVEPLY